MGGYGSGGQNKTHGSVEDCRRIDSFALHDFLKGDKYLYYKTDVKYPIIGGDVVYHVGTKTASIYSNGAYTALELSRVINPDNRTYRMYFMCPVCGKRARYIYRKNESYSCRECAGLNYESQQKSGTDELLRKMRYIVEKKLEYAYWQCECPRVMLPELLYIPKPRYMRWEKYEALIRDLRELQSKYLLIENKALAKYRNRFQSVSGSDTNLILKK